MKELQNLGDHQNNMQVLHKFYLLNKSTKFTLYSLSSKYLGKTNFKIIHES